MSEMIRRYRDDLKQGIVSEIEAGTLSIKEAASQCATSVSQVRNWLELYGTFKPKKDVVEVVMKSEQEKIAELERAVADMALKIRLYDRILEMAGTAGGVDLKKNIGNLPYLLSVLEERHAQREAAERASAKRAKRLGTRVTGTTSGSGGRRKSIVKKK
jgi:transposase-like protein